MPIDRFVPKLPEDAFLDALIPLLPRINGLSLGGPLDVYWKPWLALKDVKLLQSSPGRIYSLHNPANYFYNHYDGPCHCRKCVADPVAARKSRWPAQFN